MSEINKKQTLGRFDIVGEISVDDKVFALNTKGKNNINWTSNIFNPRIEGPNGASMFMRVQDGFDAVKGKTIYTRSVNDESMDIQFKDRLNPAIASMVNDKSFIKVFTNKVEKANENGITFMSWDEPRKFLTTYDAIDFLQKIMEMGKKYKVRIIGEVKYSTYNGKTQRNFEMKNIYILTNNEEVGKERELTFNFTQNIIILKDAVEMDRFETENIATVNAKLYVRKAKDMYELIDLPLTVRAKEETKDICRRMLQKYMTVSGDTVRRINVEGIFNVGYVSGNITESDLPEQALELIEDGFYPKEEILKMYMRKERVDETLIRRPLIKMTDNGATIDMSEEDYTMEDIKLAMENADKEVVVKVETKSMDDNDLLSELDIL
jgi:hypothetical protein